MQQTEKYKFNLIETSDPFSPDALNKNTEAVEAALIKHETAVDQRASAHEAAMDARVTAAEQGAYLVKLGSGTGSKTQYITFDLSKVNMNDYAALILFGAAVGPGGSATSLMNLTLSLGGVSLNHIARCRYTESTSGMMVLQPLGSYVMSASMYGSTSADSLTTSDYSATSGSRITYNWANITELRISSGGSASAAVSLYGVKK